jgi:hypothetical protein
MSWRVSIWQTAELRALAFLQRGPLVRRARGWRFGTARIDGGAVERLVAAGKAFIRGDELWLVVAPPVLCIERGGAAQGARAMK